jgi:hypothetical protein
MTKLSKARRPVIVDDREHPYDDDPRDARSEEPLEMPFVLGKRRLDQDIGTAARHAKLRSIHILEPMYRLSHSSREAFAVLDYDTAEPVGYADLGSVLGEDAAEAGESSRASGFHVIGFTAHPEMQSQDDHRQYAPRKSKRNLDKEKRSRGTLREKARLDTDAFHSALPSDILDRLVIPSGDDVRFQRDKPMKPWGLVPALPIRHPSLPPTWKQAQGEHRDWFQAPPKFKLKQAPGIAIGWETEAMDCLAFRNIHGVRIGLLAAERPPRGSHRGRLHPHRPDG